MAFKQQKINVKCVLNRHIKQRKINIICKSNKLQNIYKNAISLTMTNF
jgi:hypothetical protein